MVVRAAPVLLAVLLADSTAAASLRLGATVGDSSLNCAEHPELCDLDDYCRLDLDPNDRNNVIGTCVSSTPSVDCYRFPGTCAANKWCQLEDRDSWDSNENVTKGRCVSYQNLCDSCSRSGADSSAALGLPLESVLLGQLAEVTPSRTHLTVEDLSPQFGAYPERQTLCNGAAGLVCTGDLIPSLPSTCVQARNTSGPDFQQEITAEILLDWGQRWMRMGARTIFERKTGAGLDSQLPQGISREDLHKSVNLVFEALWPSALGTWPGPMTVHNDGPGAPLCCQWTNYTSQLSDFQQSHQGASWRNPVSPGAAETGNPPPCVWCEWDGAYNDENPTIWKTIHALTFNLPDVVSEAQYSVLRALPPFLRMHLSCSLCRSHVGEHLIDLGVPTSRNGVDWAFFFWRAHNYVNEQSEVTRCGSQDCEWGSWSSPAPEFLCAGVYRYPWFMTWQDANAIWKKKWSAVAPKAADATTQTQTATSATSQ